MWILLRINVVIHIFVSVSHSLGVVLFFDLCQQGYFVGSYTQYTHFTYLFMYFWHVLRTLAAVPCMVILLVCSVTGDPLVASLFFFFTLFVSCCRGFFWFSLHMLVMYPLVTDFLILSLFYKRRPINILGWTLSLTPWNHCDICVGAITVARPFIYYTFSEVNCPRVALLPSLTLYFHQIRNNLLVEILQKLCRCTQKNWWCLIGKGVYSKYCFNVDLFSIVHLKHFVNTILKSFLVHSVFSFLIMIVIIITIL